MKKMFFLVSTAVILLIGCANDVLAQKGSEIFPAERKEDVFKPTEKYTLLIKKKPVVLEHEHYLRYRLTENGKVTMGEMNTERGYKKDRNATVFVLNSGK